MKISIISNIARQTRARLFGKAMALTLAVAPMGAQPPLALATSQPAGARNKTADMAPQWSLSGVRHLIGLPGVKQRVAGKLWAAAGGIGFESEGATA